jgi:hypothetical protein
MVTSGVQMNDLGGHRRWRRALGPVKRSRARRRTRVARAMTVVGATLLTCLSASAAMANAASPTASPLAGGSVVQNADGTVTVNATGNWVWAFGVESPTTAGLQATINKPCDTRSGVGWGIAWNDPNDPGFAENYHSNGRIPQVTQMVNVGSRGANPLNGDGEVMFNGRARCGLFVQTNVPRPGDGYDIGTWSGTHVYASAASLPTDICVITYDLGFAKPPGPHRLTFDNNDNSVQWALFKSGTWDSSITDGNCAKLPPAVAAPPTATPPPPVVKTVSQTAPPPPPAPATPRAPAPPPTPAATSATSPSGTLAFTGFGRIGQLVALVGVILVLLGIAAYFVDVRKAAAWFLGL